MSVHLEVRRFKAIEVQPLVFSGFVVCLGCFASKKKHREPFWMTFGALGRRSAFLEEPWEVLMSRTSKPRLIVAGLGLSTSMESGALGLCPRDQIGQGLEERTSHKHERNHQDDR